MPGTLGVSDDHVALHHAARRFLLDRCPPAVPRALLEAGDGDTAERPPFWDDLAALGWLGLHLSEDVGGSGYGLSELVVVLEELGRVAAPGPFVPTVLASAVIDRYGSDEARARWLPGLADGSITGAVGFAGEGAPVLGAAAADVVVVWVSGHWLVVSRRDCEVTAAKNVDMTRRAALVGVPDGGSPGASLRDLPDGAIEEVAAVLLGAEAVGVAAWCVDTAAEYACVREQFGRPIGQFQAVKHRCADMLCALESARAAVWDAARALDETHPSSGVSAADADAVAGASLAAQIAGALAPEAAVTCTKGCVQVLGGIGFTWEHDAHLYLKRSLAVRALLGGTVHPWRARTFALARAGARRDVVVDLPPEAAPWRAEVDAFLEDLRNHDKSEWRARMADAGYITPHWPRPFGRDAGPVEQLVIDEAFRAARVRRPHLQVGAWALPTLIAHGSPEQHERWVGPTLRGEIAWCQLFSEPGAGSDLAALTTKGVKVDGGWLLSGQKVWTSMAKDADVGICLARTDPSAPKHEGISCFVVDMTAPGIDIRPLRELTGFAMFNEVFLSDVFVPDDALVGEPHHGWSAARTTLANERVSMGSGSSFGLGVQMLLGSVGEDGTVTADELGGLLAEAQALAALGLRLTVRALGRDAASAAEPGPESSVRKLLSAEHDQKVQEVGLGLLGSAGALDDGEAAQWLAGFLANRCLTIAGGTSEIQRNVIAERLLGLPKD